MKKVLSFLFLALPLGVVLSVLLSVILGMVTFCRSFADYWSFIIVQFFPIYGASDVEEPAEELGVWERHQARLDAQEKDNTKSNHKDSCEESKP
jgi:hypothetical protein